MVSHSKISLKDSFYFSLLVLYLCFAWIENETLMMVLKPMLLGTIIFFALMSNVDFEGKKWMIFGFVFSLIGDIILMYQQEIIRSGEVVIDTFMMGLLSFMIGLICYIFAFWKDTDFDIKPNKRLYLSNAIILLSIYSIYLLNPYLGALQIPVFIYASVLSMMTISAILRNQHYSPYSYIIVSIGAFLFMLSDLELAFNKFYSPIDHASFFNMLLYGTGQFLIFRGKFEIRKNHLV